MRVIDMNTWPRREHYRFLSSFNHPHFSMCANVDLTVFRPAVKEQGLSFTVAFLYVLARAANAVREFRYRIRAGIVVEHELVHPALTLLVDDDLFAFCTVGYAEDFAEFAARAAARIAHAKAHPTVKNEPGQDNVLYISVLPWVSFTSFEHPMRLHPADSIPRFAWGKFFEEGDSLKMPLSVQAHHALVDGIHMGKFYANVQELLDEPAFLVGKAPDR